jgi:hypothetical protein
MHSRNNGTPAFILTLRTGLIAGQPVAQPVSLLRNVGDVGQAGGASSAWSIPFFRASETQLPHRGEPDINSRGRRRLHACPPLH